MGDDFPRPKRKGGEPGRPRFADPNPDEYSEFNDSDFGDAPQFEWDESSEHVEPTNNDDSDHARGIRTNVEGGEDDRAESTRVLSKSIDTSRYVVYTSAKRNHITARRGEREKRARTRTYKEAVKKLSDISRAKALRASRTSKISKRVMPECIKRAGEWQNCHSSSTLRDLAHVILGS